MREIKHALTDGIYGIDPETGLVLVKERGLTGWFDYQGQWKAGDHFYADPEMCNWIGGPGADGGYDKPFKNI
jgi:hypothetical protein